MDFLFPLARLAVLVSFSAIAYWIGRLNPSSTVVILVPTPQEDLAHGGCGLLAYASGATAVLPGGPRGRTENWREAAVRTLFQQTGIVTNAESLVLMDVATDADGRVHIICETQTVTASGAEPRRKANVFVAREPEDLGNALHRGFAETWFQTKAPARVE